MEINKFNNLKVKSGGKSARFVIDLKKDLAEENKEVKDRKSSLIESKLEKLAELDYGQMLKTGGQNVKKNFAAYAKTVCSRNFWATVFTHLKVIMVKWPKVTENKIPPPTPRLRRAGLTPFPPERLTSFSWAGIKGAKSRAKALADKQAGVKSRIPDQVRQDRFGGWFWQKINQLAFVALAKLIYAILKQTIILIYKICYGAGWLIIFGLRLIYLLFAAISRPLIKSLEFLAIQFHPLIAKSSNLLVGGYRATQAVALAMFMGLIRPWRWLAKARENNITPLSPPSRQNDSVGLVSGGRQIPSNPLRQLADQGGNQNSTYFTSWRIGAVRQGNEYNPPNPPATSAGQALYQGGIKGVLAFAGVLLIMILPVKALTYYKTIDSAKGKVMGASESAVNELIAGGQAAANFNFKQADKSFSLASQNFIVAQDQLKEINGWLFSLASLAPNDNLRLAAASQQITRAGELSAAAGKNLSSALESLFQAGQGQNFLPNLSAAGHQAIINLTALANELKQIDSQILPAAYQEKFILLKQKTAEIKLGLERFIGLVDSLDNFLGLSVNKRYLLVFQNNSELRASGGFIGSFALVDFSRGQIKNIEAPGGGSYDTDAGLLKKIKSPEPLRLIRPDWHFWDANWWPDWPMSARKLAWFYENSDGPTVDGVIGLTPTVMERILKVVGPMDLKEKYGSATLTAGGVVIDADNFWAITQELAEQKPNITKQPKKIIGDLLDKIIEELPKRLNQDNLLLLLKALEESLEDKNILFYFTDSELQAEVEALGWTGRVKDTAGDYLNVVNSNIAGGKSDRKIKQQVIHQAEIMSDGAIIDNLTIKRTHEAVSREPFVGVRNVDWLRIYVPLGSKLISAAGFKPVDKIFFKEAEAGWQNDPEVVGGEALALTDAQSGTKIYNELNKTVFANWSQLDPGETIEINIKYELPFKLTDKKLNLEQGFLDRFMAKAGAIINPEQKKLYSYSLLAQKQPGMNSSLVTSELKLSDNYKPIWQYPDDLVLNQNGWFRAENFDQDKLMGVMVEEK